MQTSEVLENPTCFSKRGIAHRVVGMGFVRGLRPLFFLYMLFFPFFKKLRFHSCPADGLAAQSLNLALQRFEEIVEEHDIDLA